MRKQPYGGVSPPGGVCVSTLLCRRGLRLHAAALVVAAAAILCLVGGSLSVAAGTEASSSSRWVLLDAHDLEVGTLISVTRGTQTAVVGFDLLGANFVLEATKDRFLGNTGGLFFELPDCTGTPLIIYKDSVAPLVSVAPPGNSVYIAEADSEPISVLVRSTLNTKSGRCENKLIEGLELVRAKRLLNLNRFYTPPFTVRLVEGE